jgi:hypothetical protein
MTCGYTRSVNAGSVCPNCCIYIDGITTTGKECRREHVPQLVRCYTARERVLIALGQHFLGALDDRREHALGDVVLVAPAAPSRWEQRSSSPARIPALCAARMSRRTGNRSITHASVCLRAANLKPPTGKVEIANLNGTRLARPRAREHERCRERITAARAGSGARV